MVNAEKTFRAHRALAVVYVVVLGLVLWLVSERGNAVTLAPVLLLFGVIVTGHSVVAYGARARKPWARIASLVWGCLMLIGIPVGTIIGIYLISNAWSAWKPEGPRLSDSMGEGWPQQGASEAA